MNYDFLDRHLRDLIGSRHVVAGPEKSVTDRFASIRQKWQSLCNKCLSNISNLIRYRAGNFINEISTKYQLAVQLTYHLPSTPVDGKQGFKDSYRP